MLRFSSRYFKFFSQLPCHQIQNPQWSTYRSKVPHRVWRSHGFLFLHCLYSLLPHYHFVFGRHWWYPQHSHVETPDHMSHYVTSLQYLLRRHFVNLSKHVEIKCQLDATDDFCCRSYCLLNMFRAPLCPSPGAREYYTSGCCLSYLVLWFSSYRYGVELRVMCPFCGFAGFRSSPQTEHITLSSIPYWQLENQSTKYHRQQPSV